MSEGWTTLTEFREQDPRGRSLALLLRAPAPRDIRLDDGRLHPIGRAGGEDVFKSSWVHFSR